MPNVSQHGAKKINDTSCLSQVDSKQSVMQKRGTVKVRLVKMKAAPNA